MSDRNPEPPERDAFGKAVARDTDRMSKRPRRKSNPMLGLATLGVIGWSVVVPMLLGVAAGMALDRRFPQPQISWTLSLLFLGLGLGIFNAIYWVDREQRRIERECREEHRD
jgi:ATP synthase protein I